MEKYGQRKLDDADRLLRVYDGQTGYFEHGFVDKIAYFDMFFRKVPDGGGYAIMVGVEQLIEYLKNLRFYQEDIEFLRNKDIFCEAFLDYLRDFKFECDVWAVPEGMPIFPGEPIVTVRGRDTGTVCGNDDTVDR